MDDRVGTRVGQQLGNYRLVHLLGQGGFAEVYLGEHRYLKAQAAIKVLRAQLPRQDLESFLTEARLIARLRHPSIVGVLEFGVESGTPFLVMDYAPNGTLKQRHPRGIPLPVATVVSYVKQVAEALQYAHDQKLVHRDVKPENMLLGPNNEVLLSDFGVAVIDQSSGDQRERIVGTVAYMAPEQLQGKPNPASDQYALGIVVYAWLTGDLPFHGAFVQVASQHILTSPPSLREKVPTIPPAVEQVVLRALAKEPRQRFNSVQAFADALEQANQSGASVPLIPPSASDLSPAASSLGSKTLPVEQSLAPGSPLAPLSAKPQPRPGHFWKATALFSALVLLIIGGGLTYYTLALQPGQMHLQATNTARHSDNRKLPVLPMLLPPCRRRARAPPSVLPLPRHRHRLLPRRYKPSTSRAPAEIRYSMTT
jgi:serine/threonine protein kinase